MALSEKALHNFSKARERNRVDWTKHETFDTDESKKQAIARARDQKRSKHSKQSNHSDHGKHGNPFHPIDQYYEWSEYRLTHSRANGSANMHSSSYKMLRTLRDRRRASVTAPLMSKIEDKAPISDDIKSVGDSIKAALDDVKICAKLDQVPTNDDTKSANTDMKSANVDINDDKGSAIEPPGGKRCSADGCQKVAYFASKGQQATHCKTHREKNDKVEYNYPSCVECNQRALHKVAEIAESLPSFCDLHRPKTAKDMVAEPAKIREEEKQPIRRQGYRSLAELMVAHGSNAKYTVQTKANRDGVRVSYFYLKR